MENPIRLEEYERFSEPSIPVTEPPCEPQAMEARPFLRSFGNLQNASTARQPFDS